MKTNSQMPELTDNPKRTEDCTATVCKSCHTSLDNAPVIGKERRQVFDIPAIRMKVTEYRVEVRKCPKCEHKNHLNFPGWINQRTQYGPNVRRYAVYFNKYLRVPLKETVETFQDIFGTTISESFIAEAVQNDGQSYDSKYCPEFIKDHKDIEIKLIKVKICKKCGYSLEKATIVGYIRRQVFDIPTVGMEVTEYQGKIRQCPNCKNRNQPDFPNSVTEYVQYGDNLISHALYYANYLRIPVRKATKIFKDIFGYTISEAWLYKYLIQNPHNYPNVYEISNRNIKAVELSYKKMRAEESANPKRVVSKIVPVSRSSVSPKPVYRESARSESVPRSSGSLVKFIIVILLSIFPIIYYNISNQHPLIFKEIDIEQELADIRGQIEKIDAEFRKIRLSDEEISELKADNLSTGYINHFKCKVLGTKISRYQILSFFDITRKGSVNLNAEGKTYKISVITGHNRGASGIPADSEVDELLKKIIYDEDKLEDKLKRLYDINDHTDTLYFMDDICFRLVYDHPIKIPYEKYIKALKIKYVGSEIKRGNSKTWFWEKGDFKYEISNPRAGIVRVKALHKTILSQVESVIEKAQKEGERK